MVAVGCVQRHSNTEDDSQATSKSTHSNHQQVPSFHLPLLQPHHVTSVHNFHVHNKVEVMTLFVSRVHLSAVVVSGNSAFEKLFFHFIAISTSSFLITQTIPTNNHTTVTSSTQLFIHNLHQHLNHNVS